MIAPIDILRQSTGLNLSDIFNGKARAYKANQRAKFAGLVSKLEKQCNIAKDLGYDFRITDKDDYIKLVFEWPTSVQVRRYYADRDMSHRRLNKFIEWMEYLNSLGRVA